MQKNGGNVAATRFDGLPTKCVVYLILEKDGKRFEKLSTFSTVSTSTKEGDYLEDFNRTDAVYRHSGPETRLLL
jgi:hypothetical protein